MRIIILILIFSCSSHLLFSQIKRQVKGSLNYTSSTPIDSIFIDYKEPILPDSLYTLEWNEINVVCDVVVGVDGKVISIYTYPLNKNCIYFSEDDLVWELVADSIKTASKHWKFQIIEWDIESIEPEEAKDTFRRYNERKSAQASYLLTISICNECRGNNHSYYHHINSSEYEEKYRNIEKKANE